MVLTPKSLWRLEGAGEMSAGTAVSSEGLAGAGGAAPRCLTHMAMGQTIAANGRRPQFLATWPSQQGCLSIHFCTILLATLIHKGEKPRW